MCAQRFLGSSVRRFLPAMVMSDRRLGMMQVRAALQVTVLARILQPLLKAVDGLRGLTQARQRDFLAAWGATMQAKGDWGEDQGNVVYAAGWGLLVALNNGKAQCCNITSRASGAQMMETLMGIMYWARVGLGTLEEFRAECLTRQMGQKEVWNSTYRFLKKEALGAETLLGWYGGVDEYLRWWGDLFSGSVVGGLLDRWKYNKLFLLERVLHVVECVRRGWWGLEDELRDKMFLCTTWPPRVVDGELVGGIEALTEYARQAGVPVEVWLSLPCLADAGLGGAVET